MIDFLKADPSTLPASAGLDAWLAEKRMGWKEGHRNSWVAPDGAFRAWRGLWSPSTNPAHAGEARRKAGRSRVYHLPGKCIAHIHSAGRLHRAVVLYTEVTGDTEEEIKGKAEALATVRALVAAIQTAEKMKRSES